MVLKINVFQLMSERHMSIDIHDTYVSMCTCLCILHYKWIYANVHIHTWYMYDIIERKEQTACVHGHVYIPTESSLQCGPLHTFVQLTKTIGKKTKKKNKKKSIG